jgi:hypothetical protein
MRLADIIPFCYSVGLVTVFASRHSRRLGDYVANTVVVAEAGSDVATYESLFSGEEVDAALCRQAPVVDFDGDIAAVTPAEIARRRDLPPTAGSDPGLPAALARLAGRRSAARKDTSAASIPPPSVTKVSLKN